MNYLAAAITQQGNNREINQDALMIRNKVTALGNVCLAVICDGMGGLSLGEVASSHVVRRIAEWFVYRSGGIGRFDKFVYYLECELKVISKEIYDYGKRCGFVCGTTATILVMCGAQYAILHVGDTRVYTISKKIGVRIEQKTTDHSINDYMLTRSIGTSETVIPQMIRGRYTKNDMFLLCSDGFRHKNLPGDLKKGFNTLEIKNTATLEKKLRIYVDRARKLGETDDISVLVIKAV